MITMTRKIFFSRGPAGRKLMSLDEPAVARARPGRTPRISKLMALAIRFDSLIEESDDLDITELARLAHVTGPRMTQIMNLLHLAPDIQEELLHLPEVTLWRDPIHEKMLRRLTAVIAWPEQRRQWRAIKQKLADYAAAKEIELAQPQKKPSRPPAPAKPVAPAAPPAPLAIRKVTVRVNPGSRPAGRASA